MTYVNKVADFYVARFAGVRMLSAEDYTMIAEWEKQNIPVAIVLRSINDVYYSYTSDGIEIKTIGECDETVRNIFRDWLEIKSP